MKFFEYQMLKVDYFVTFVKDMYVNSLLWLPYYMFHFLVHDNLFVSHRSLSSHRIHPQKRVVHDYSVPPMLDVAPMDVAEKEETSGFLVPGLPARQHAMVICGVVRVPEFFLKLKAKTDRQKSNQRLLHNCRNKLDYLVIQP